MKSIRRTDMTISLTQEEKDMVLNAISEELRYGDGDFDIFVELNDSLTIEAQGHLYTEGYREADNNGFNETGRNADLILTAFVSTHGWDEEVFDVDSEFEQEAWAFVQAA